MRSTEMNRRSLIIVLLAVAAGATLLAGSFLLAERWCAHRVANSADNLDWLKQEFGLSDTELERVRALHDGYLPKCEEMCQQIAVKKSELENALASATNVTTTVETKLAELGALRARCQARMLQHFMEVSQVMPPGQGRRYLKEMERLTLGFHEQFEQSMSQPPDNPHGSH